MREALADYPVPPKGELARLWKRYDYNGNGMLSLAEIDKLVSSEYPEYDNKAALMRSYKFADQDGSGFITKREFGTLVRSLAYFKGLSEEFAEIDTSDDRRIDFEEFVAGAPRGPGSVASCPFLRTRGETRERARESRSEQERLVHTVER